MSRTPDPADLVVAAAYSVARARAFGPQHPQPLPEALEALDGAVRAFYGHSFCALPFPELPCGPEPE